MSKDYESLFTEALPSLYHIKDISQICIICKNDEIGKMIDVLKQN